MASYTEQDIQDYLDGSFAGDKADLQRFLEQDAGAQKQVQLYNLLYAGIKGQPAISLSIDLAGAVMARLQKRAAAKDLWWTRAALITMSLLVLLALAVSYQYFGMEKLFDAIGVGLLSVFILFFAAFIFGFHFIELQVKKKKFSLSFNEPGY